MERRNGSDRICLGAAAAGARFASLSALALSLAACSAGSHTLVVSLATDLCPDTASAAGCREDRFDTVVVTLADGPTVARAVSGRDDYPAGQQVAELRELSAGVQLVTVSLQRDGVTVASASRSVELVSALHAVTFAVGSACARVSCPTEGEPEATECVSGQCVDPSCFDEGVIDEVSCGALCTGDADCVASAPCFEARCVANVCLELARDERCGPSERCVASLGCFGGVLEGDPCLTADDCGDTDLICCGLECRQPDCDDGNGCTDDACTRDGCENVPVEAACDDGVFCNGADACEAGACLSHEGNPCGAPLVCDEGTAECAGCLADADCPAASERALGACTGFADFCGETGTQVWELTTFGCVSRSCVAASTTENRACSRDRTALSCDDGEATCQSGACRCGGGGSCGSNQYCRSGSCWDRPRLELYGNPTPGCVDAARGPEPGPLLGYRVYGRPGARVHKFNRHASCGAGWLEAPETADAVITLDASGLYDLPIDAADPLPCDFGQHGLFEQYVEVDGVRTPETGSIESVFYNTGAGCGAALATCSAARTFCP